VSALKKLIPTLILILIVYLWFFLVHAPSNPSSVNVLGAKTSIALFEEPDAGRAPILDAIGNAKQEILLEVYLLSDKQIISALEDAKKRGLQVNVMLEEHPFGGGNLNPKTKKMLEESGISVKWTNPAFALTHEKVLVIDKTEAFIMSQNLTTSSFTKNREYDVIDTDPVDVGEARTIFIDDWDRKSFTPGVSHLVVSPNTSRGGIAKLISDSAKTIDMEFEEINDNQTERLLAEKAHNVSIRLIIPTLSQVSSNTDNVKALTSAGVLIKTLSSPYIHAKMILADQAKAYVGSVNISTQSMDENREVGIMVEQGDALQTIKTAFESDWNKATPLN